MRKLADKILVYMIQNDGTVLAVYGTTRINDPFIGCFIGRFPAEIKSEMRKGQKSYYSFYDRFKSKRDFYSRLPAKVEERTEVIELSSEDTQESLFKLVIAHYHKLAERKKELKKLSRILERRLLEL